MNKDEITNEEEALEAVKRDGWALGYVPDELMTASPKEFGALCLEAVKQDGRMIVYVPEELKTAELCLEAVKHHSFAFEYVPLNLRTAKLCLEALKSGYWIRKQFLIYEKFETAKLYFEAVKNRIGKPLRKCRKSCGTKSAAGLRARSDTRE